jgi:hypothetical protein
MRGTVALAGLMVLVACGTSAAQGPCKRKDDGKDSSAFLSERAKVVRPAGFTEAATVSLRVDKTIASAAKDLKPGAEWTPFLVDLMSTAAGSKPAALVWSEGGQTCAEPVTFSTKEESETKDEDVGAAGVLDEVECQAQGQAWLTAIAPGGTGRRPESVNMLVFREDGGVCYESNFRPRQGNPIYVGVFTDEALKWSAARVTFQPCSLEPTAPNVLVQGKLGTFTSELHAGGQFTIHKFSPRPCWDPTVVVQIDTKAGEQLAHTLQQATLYRATVHLGTVFTENHETTFGLRPESDTVNRVFAQGPVDKGPEYVAALVFYSLLRYIPPLGGRAAYPGRDPVRDNSFVDKLGGVIGVGLRNPLKRFITGFSFEIAAGVNVLTVWDWAETSVLAGIKEGDVFPGDPEEIPTRKEWRQKFVVGVSMDLVYASNAFRR